MPINDAEICTKIMMKTPFFNLGPPWGGHSKFMGGTRLGLIMHFWPKPARGRTGLGSDGNLNNGKGFPV